MQSNLHIKVEQQSEQEDKYIFSVTIESGRTKTEHTVTVDKDYYQKLSGEEELPQGLVERSLRFLLDREPQGAILKKFNLSVIPDYFSEYEETIKK